jgi:hypothetical protein
MLNDIQYISRTDIKIANYTITNIVWSLAFGMIGYIGGRTIARDLSE